MKSFSIRSLPGFPTCALTQQDAADQSTGKDAQNSKRKRPWREGGVGPSPALREEGIRQEPPQGHIRSLREHVAALGAGGLQANTDFAN